MCSFAVPFCKCLHNNMHVAVFVCIHNIVRILCEHRIPSIPNISHKLTKSVQECSFYLSFEHFDFIIIWVRHECNTHSCLCYLEQKETLFSLFLILNRFGYVVCMSMSLPVVVAQAMYSPRNLNVACYNLFFSLYKQFSVNCLFIYNPEIFWARTN